MKQQLKKIALVIVVFASTSAFADKTTMKAAFRPDFNKMIENNNHQSKKIHEVFDQASDSSDQDQTETADKGKAIDFINVEVSVGQPPTMVDRRFDSVGAPIAVVIED